MNRIKTAIVILFLVTAFCVCEYVYVGNTVDEFIGRLDEIEKTYANEDYEEALRLAKEADKGWNQRLEYVDMLLYHDYVSEIGVNIAGIADYIEYREDAEVFTNCKKTKRELESLFDNEKPSLANIF